MRKTRLMTKDELAVLLGTSTQTITNQINQGREGDSVPHAMRLGKSYRWSEDSVFQWIREKEHERKVLRTHQVKTGTDIPKVKINRI